MTARQIEVDREIERERRGRKRDVQSNGVLY